MCGITCSNVELGIGIIEQVNWFWRLHDVNYTNFFAVQDFNFRKNAAKYLFRKIFCNNVI